MVAELLLDAAVRDAPLGVAAAVSASHSARRSRVTALPARTIAAGVRGALRWALHAEDRAWIAARFELPLQDTPFARRARRVALRHYALTQRCLTVEALAAGRAGARIVSEAGPPPQPAIFTFVHGPGMWLCLYGVTNAGIPFSPVVADWFWEDPGFDVRAAAIRATGGEILPATAGFDRLAEELEQGRSVGIAADVPGRNPVRFLGKDARVRSGVARLAQATGVPIVPMRGDFRAGRPVAVLGAPLHPHDDTDALLREVVAAVEAPVLARPERWMPYTADLWPDRSAPFRAAYDEDRPAAEVGSTA